MSIMSEEEKIERLLNSIAKGCDGSIADEVKAIIIKQQKEIEEYQKCFEDIERHQKNQMQMQKELWKRLKGEIDE